MNKKILFGIILFLIIITGVILIWQFWLKSQISLPKEITLPEDDFAINTRYHFAFTSNLPTGVESGEYNTLIYEDGRVFATQDLNGIVQIKQCQSISLEKVKEEIVFFDSPFLKGLSDQGNLPAPGESGDYEVIVNSTSGLRKIVLSSDYTRIVEFNDYYNEITSLCSFMEGI
jgi:hypothetical protein